MSIAEQLTKIRTALARALPVADVDQIGRDTARASDYGPSRHRLFLSTIAGLADGSVASISDLLRDFNHHNDVTVAYKAFYKRLARPGFAKFM